MIVSKEEPVTLVGGADVTKSQVVTALALAPHVVAADGGADAALANGIVPEAVIGDFDSLSDAARAALPEATLHRIEDQDSTDFDKCLRNISAPVILGIGFSGNRFDHQLAAYNVLVRRPARRCVLLGTEELAFLAPPSITLPLVEGTTVSLFPMGAVEGISDGLRWPIGGLSFAPDGRIGTSNAAMGEVSLSFTAPKMLVILPAETVEVVIAALASAPARWDGP